jgi:hypothetical protein
MSSNTSRNRGVKTIASFEDRATPLHAPAGMNRPGKASRSANDGIQLVADFEDNVLPLSGSETGSLDTLNMLFAQHEQKIQRLVNKLQGMIEELKKQNADLKAILLEKDRVIERYYLDGPNEDEI